MTPTQSFAGRATLALIAAAVSIALPAARRFFTGPAERFNRNVLGAFALTRFGLFALIFLVLRIPPRGDIPSYYLPEAESVLAGHLPYRDLPSSYAPLHPYLDAVAVSLWHSPLALTALAPLAEGLLVCIWPRATPAFASEPARRTAALLYLASPLSLQFVTIDGQDNILIALALGLCLLLLSARPTTRARPLLSGAVLGLSIAAVKFLPLLWLPPFFVSLRTRWRWLLGLMAALLLGYGFFALKHLDLLSPLKAEGSLVSASNLPYLLTLLSGHAFSLRSFDLLLLLALAAAFLWLATLARQATPERRLHLIAWSVPFVTLLLILLSKKSWPNYLLLILFSLCLLPSLRRPSHRVGFAFLQFLGCTAHSYWATFFLLGAAVPLHARLMTADPRTLLLAITQAALILGYFWLLLLTARELRRPTP